MASVSRTIGLAAFIVIVPGALRAEGPPKGSYQTDVWGRVELSTSEQNRVLGLLAKGQPCGLAPGERVLEGDLQGQVLVGQYTVCLKGSSCPQKKASLPVLALHDPRDGTVTTYVRPQAGCEVPGTQDGRVVLYALPSEEPGTGGAPGRPFKRNPKEAMQALDRGDQFMKEKNWAAAAAEFEHSVALNDQSWAALLGLGTARVMLNQPAQAIEVLKRARLLNKSEPVIDYQLACAYSRQSDSQQAMEHLERAVELKLALEPRPVAAGLSRVLGGNLRLAARYVSLIQQATQNALVGRRPAPGP
jgi:tetratricopeptide (TPR) repeat protein